MTGHLVLRINYIHQEQKCSNIQLKWINTENNVADILTKAIPNTDYEKHSTTLMHRHNGLPTNISILKARTTQINFNVKTYIVRPTRRRIAVY